MIRFSKILFTSTVCFLISCNAGESGENVSVQQEDERPEDTVSFDEEIVDDYAVEYNDQIEYTFGDISTWSENTVLADGIVSRGGEEGNWSKVEILNIFGFEVDPGKGEYVQVIPMVEGIPSIALQITKIEGRDDMNPGIIDWYSVELEEVRNKAYFDAEAVEGQRAEYPFSVFVIYPGVSTAQLLPVNHIQNEDLPEGVTTSVVTGALDIDEDDKPDAIICDFCCSDSSTAENCEYYCSANYIKSNGVWHKVYDGSPM